MFEYSDGGKEKAGMTEKQDCTVRAFAIVSGVNYKIVHDLCKQHGRKDGHRFMNFKKSIQPIAKSLRLKLEQVKRSGSLGKLLSEYPSGTLFVQVRGHVCAVINGIVKDTWKQSENRHIRGAWIVLKQSNTLCPVIKNDAANVNCVEEIKMNEPKNDIPRETVA